MRRTSSSKPVEEPEYPPTQGLPRKKNTKRWCKGKVGREHVFVSFKKFQFYTFAWHVDKCTLCGKEANWHTKPTSQPPQSGS